MPKPAGTWSRFDAEPEVRSRRFLGRRLSTVVALMPLVFFSGYAVGFLVSRA